MKIPIILAMYTSTMMGTPSNDAIKIIPRPHQLECPIHGHIRFENQPVDDLFLGWNNRIVRGNYYNDKNKRRLPPIHLEIYYDRRYNKQIRHANRRIYVCEHGYEYQFYFMQ